LNGKHGRVHQVAFVAEAAMSLPSSETKRPIVFVTDDMIALFVYVMYCVGYFNLVTALIGVGVAYARVGDSDPVLHSHYQFQIRTFWIGLLYLTIGIPLCLVLIGFPILAWWFLWSLIRIIKGINLVNERRPIANPRSWLFG
jgi:uncharacterized membrane protein